MGIWRQGCDGGYVINALGRSGTVLLKPAQLVAHGPSEPVMIFPDVDGEGGRNVLRSWSTQRLPEQGKVENVVVALNVPHHFRLGSWWASQFAW
ncbi:hypothetical protein [Rhodococcus koreensis]